MKLHDITNMDKDDVLGMLGLEAQALAQQSLADDAGDLQHRPARRRGRGNCCWRRRPEAICARTLRAKLRRDGSDGVTAGSATQRTGQRGARRRVHLD